MNAVIESHYVRRKATNGQPYFVLRAANNEVLGTNELYACAAGCDGGIAAVKATASNAVIDDQT